MRKFFSLFIAFVVFISLSTLVHANEESWNKYPDNSHKSFMSAEDFYEKVVDKSEYKEFSNAKLNVREKTTWQELNNTYEKYNITDRNYGDGFHPNRQLYMFASISKDGKSTNVACYDAEKEILISKSTEPASD